MLKYLLTATLLTAANAFAQIPYIDSKEMLTKGIELYDKGEYKKAIEQYQQIHECDTNYALARYETILALTADKAYEEAKAVAKDGLKLRDANKREYMLALGAAYDYLKQTDSAIAVYDSLARKNPNDHQPVFELGIIYLRQENYDKALSYFQRSLRINPNHYTSHYMTGLCYALQGRLSESFIALECSLLMTSNEKTAKKSISVISSLTTQTDEMVKFYKDKKEQYSHPLFDEIDQIVNSKIALSKDYKLKISINDDIFRQSQVIVEKLKYDPDDTNFVMQFYVPLLTDVFKNDMFEAFTLLQYSGYGFENVDNLTKKKSKEITEVKGVVFPYFTKIQETRELNYAKRQNAPERYHYYPGDNLIVVGNNAKNGKNTVLSGDVTVYRGDHNIHSKGLYDDGGMKNGWWNYYYSTGELKSKEYFDHGKRIDSAFVYYDNGNLKDITIRDKEGEAKEEFEFDRAGWLSYRKKVLPGDIIEEWSYFPNGQMEYDEKYNKKKLVDGDYTIFYSNGKVKKKVSYQGGQISGPNKMWFENGRLREDCNFVAGKLDGTYSLYYENGRLKEKSTYKNGKQEGIEEKYDEKGRLTDKYVYENGKTVEMYRYNPGGMEYAVMKVSKNAPYYIKYVNEEGKTLVEKEDKGGIFVYKIFHANGNLAVEQKLNEEGKRDGLITFYSETGSKNEETNYKDGLLEGKSVLYYRYGKTKQEANYVNDQLDGYFKNYHPNGTLKSEGWYKAGKRQGPWKLYYINGKLETEQYYVDDVLTGNSKEYNINGEIEDKYFHDHGLVYSHVCYDTAGHAIDSIFYNPASAICKTTHLAANPQVKELEYGVKNGAYNGEFTRRYLDGTISEKSNFKDGKRNGECIERFHDGKLRLKGTYASGIKTGKWEYYNEDGLLSFDETYKEDGNTDVSTIYSGGEIKRIVYGDSATVYYGDPGRIALILYYDDGNVISYTHEGKDGKLLPPVKVKYTTAITAYYSNGQKSAELQLEQYLFKGGMAIYYSDGKLSENINYDTNFLADGPRNRFNATGKPILETFYKDDEESGMKKTYDKDGNQLLSANYYYGVLNGPMLKTDAKTHETHAYYYHFGRLTSVRNEVK